MLDEVRNLQLGGRVGFDTLPDQLVSKAIHKGFVFNILCIGETGVGKSTLMDSLFNTNFKSAPSPHTLSSVKLESHIYELQESNVEMKLTIVDTVGYGDQVNKEGSFKAIVDHIDQQFEGYLLEELKIKRCLPLYHDSRIHACLYFISPTGTGHRLKPIDLVCMKTLDSKVNIIPIIAKADSISKSELQKFKEKIVSEFASNGIKIYRFPIDDESVAEVNTSMNSHIPFAVVGSSEYVRVGNKMMRARHYPWGTVEVENETHCDFVKLKEMLIRTNMEDMRERTHMLLYEFYRRQRLIQMGFSDVDVADGIDGQSMSFQQTCEKKMLLQQQELAQKEEDMKQHFILRVNDKEAELREAERELHAKFEHLKEENGKDEKKLEDHRKKLEDEMAEFGRLQVQFQTKELSGLRHMLSVGSLGKGKKK